MAKVYIVLVLLAVIAASSVQAESEFDEEEPFRGPQEVVDNYSENNDDTLELQPRMKSFGQGEHRASLGRKWQRLYNPSAYRQEKMYRKQQKYGSMGGMNNGMYPQQQMYQRPMYQQPMYQQPMGMGMGMQQYPRPY